MVHNPFGQRYFRAHDYQVDIFLLRRFSQRFDIVSRDIDVLRNPGGAGISRCSIQFVELGTLCQFPGNRMLSSAVSNNKNFHNLPPSACILCLPFPVMTKGLN